MDFRVFHKYFPKIAEAETREITIMEDLNLIPKGSYGLIDAYCTEPGCDCRKVIFHVISSITMGVVAVIDYGWGSDKFYENWFGKKDQGIITAMKGPCLNKMAKQARYAPELLNIVKQVLSDKNYVERIKRHYAMVKEKVDSDSEALESEHVIMPKIRAVSRNSMCPCGSGKKYKRCCGRLK